MSVRHAHLQYESKSFVAGTASICLQLTLNYILITPCFSGCRACSRLSCNMKGHANSSTSNMLSSVSTAPAPLASLVARLGGCRCSPQLDALCDGVSYIRRTTHCEHATKQATRSHTLPSILPSLPLEVVSIHKPRASAFAPVATLSGSCASPPHYPPPRDSLRTSTLLQRLQLLVNSSATFARHGEQPAGGRPAVVYGQCHSRSPAEEAHP